jgi:hypothetical protein
MAFDWRRIGYELKGAGKMTRIGSGTISGGAQEYFDVELTAGKPHRIYVRPDNEQADFDLAIFDENGNLVDFDTDASADAFCVVTPNWTGPFTIAVIAASGGSSYTLVVED